MAYSPASASRFAFTALLASVLFPSAAATISVDGVKYKKLSEAVAAAIAEDDGPHIINITVDKMPLSDTSFSISEPMTINGDADGNGVKCDILVDIAGIRQMPESEVRSQKCYIELITAGEVVINDLQIHPNADASGTNDNEIVDAIRVFCPSKKNDSSNYTLNRIWISGSDGNNGDAYVSLNTYDDLFSKPGLKLWGRQVPMQNRAIIHTANRKKGPKANEQRGVYNFTMNDCQVGLTRGAAVNVTASDGVHTISGGLFGHSGREGIRIAGRSAVITGTAEKPAIIVRAGNAADGLNQNFTVFGNAHVSKIENVSIIPAPGAHNEVFNQRPGGTVGTRSNVATLTDPQAIAKAMGIEPPKIEHFKGWLSPEQAWAEAQEQKKEMLMFFYSPDVGMATRLNSLMESDKGALSFLGKKSPTRVNIKDRSGEAVAKNYGIFKVPTLLIISPDAKSYKKITPDSIDTWTKLEAQLQLK